MAIKKISSIRCKLYLYLVSLIFLFIVFGFAFAGTRPTVQITSWDLTRNQNNQINAEVSDSDCDLRSDLVWIYVKSPSTEASYNKIYAQKMNCTSGRCYSSCSYTVYPDSKWGNDARIAVVASDDINYGNFAYKTVNIYPQIYPTPTPTLSPSPTPTQTPTITPKPSRPTVQITSGDLTRNQNNQITATVTDPDGDLRTDLVWIYVKSPSSDSNYNKVWQGRMSCSGGRYSASCSYSVYPDYSWGNDATIAIVAADDVNYGSFAFKTVNIYPQLSPTPSPTPTLSPSPTPTQTPTITPKPSRPTVQITSGDLTRNQNNQIT
ncbi:MAG: hypothetical protein QXM75_03515, partial [Candidatus Diapherotrites archaeon]